MKTTLVAGLVISNFWLLSCAFASSSEFRMLLYSANNGNPADQYNVAVIYNGGRLRDDATGQVIEIDKTDTSQAVKYFQMSASQGFTPAMVELAKIYAYGPEQFRNNEEAFNLFLSAAKEGNAEAQYQVGNCFALGKGVDKDEGSARLWFQKSAANGYMTAKIRTGDVDEVVGAFASRIKRWWSEATSGFEKGYREEEFRQDMQELRKSFSQ